jgi:hypothetical protein
MSYTGVVAQSSLPVEKVCNALVTQPSEGTAGSQILTVASTDLADQASPTAPMAHTGSLVTKVAVWHISLSPLKREPLGK